MENPKQPAVFLDRDGTIIEQADYPKSESDIRILPGAASAIKALNELGYFVVIVSNQPVVARGDITLEEAHRLNKFFMDELAKQGGRIDAVYLCPHHPKANIEAHRVMCDCRKPAPGMILQAVREHNLDLAHSFLIGDSTQDVGAGKAAGGGLRTILVETGWGGKDPWQHEGKPDFIAGNLTRAVEIVRKNR